jgi:hypothetical protein
VHRKSHHAENDSESGHYKGQGRQEGSVSCEQAWDGDHAVLSSPDRRSVQPIDMIRSADRVLMGAAAASPLGTATEGTQFEVRETGRVHEHAGSAVI